MKAKVLAALRGCGATFFNLFYILGSPYSKKKKPVKIQIQLLTLVCFKQKKEAP